MPSAIADATDRLECMADDSQKPTDHEGDDPENHDLLGSATAAASAPDNAWEAYQLDVAEAAATANSSSPTTAASAVAAARNPSEGEEESDQSDGEEEATDHEMLGIPAAGGAVGVVPALPAIGTANPSVAAGSESTTATTTFKERWEIHMKKMRAFKDFYGHVNCSRSQDKEMGRFVSLQRENYRNLLEGKQSSLTVERIHDLERLGFQWRTKPETLTKSFAASIGYGLGGAEREKVLGQKADSAWHVRLKQLREFKEKSGHFRVPCTFKRGTKRPKLNGDIEDLDADTVKLGTWVKRQRYQYSNNTLSKERISALEELGFAFKPGNSTKEENLEVQLGLLDQLRKRRELSNAQMNDLNFLYDRWKRHAGNSSAKPVQYLLYQEERNKFDTRWHQTYEQLKQYRVANGHTRVKQHTSDKAMRSLGKWVDQQRQSYRKRQKGEKVALNEEKIFLLESIGFEWRIRHRLPLQKMKSLDSDSTTMQKSNLSVKDQILGLSAVFPENEPNENPISDERKWNSHFYELARYKQLFGTTTVDEEANPEYGECLRILSKWVKITTEQYKEHKKKKKSELSKVQIKRLESIGLEVRNCSWGKRWDIKLGALREFRRRNGHCRVPVKKKRRNDVDHDPEQFSLAKWVEHQRSMYWKRAKGEKNSLTDERVAGLNALGMEWRLIRNKGDVTVASLAQFNHAPMGDQAGKNAEEESDSDSEEELELSAADQVIDSIPDSLPNIPPASVDVDDGSMECHTKAEAFTSV